MNQYQFEQADPRIFNIDEKKLIGMSLRMNLINNRTTELWAGFMARRREIHQPVSADLFSLNIYESDYFLEFNPERHFIKWAAIEVSDDSKVPDGMETILLEKGQYAIFDYKGSSSDTRIYQYIYSTWLPNSKYQLDYRPHFELLGEKYRNNDPLSEEEIWIPVLERK